MTNAYLVGDPATKTAVVVDPAWNGDFIASKADERNWKITAIWLTHAHFDHFGGVAQITNASEDSIPVALHPEDLPLWELHGGAAIFGFPAFDPGPAPTILLDHGLKLRLGNYQFEVRHTPGHTQGHVIFVLEKEKLVFCGDLIFMQGVGRTDLPGGDWDTLLRSIKENILTLPDDFRLLSGHGPETTVGQERLTNPFLYELR
ncbi:MAG: MBL fold metallo-hydrolase [Anaerolineales bacterium]|nr:MBL fold metallo-hydrolase [Anaerolineales bacterium]